MFEVSAVSASVSAGRRWSRLEAAVVGAVVYAAVDHPTAIACGVACYMLARIVAEVGIMRGPVDTNALTRLEAIAYSTYREEDTPLRAPEVRAASSGLPRVP